MFYHHLYFLLIYPEPFCHYNTNNTNPFEEVLKKQNNQIRNNEGQSAVPANVPNEHIFFLSTRHSSIRTHSKISKDNIRTKVFRFFVNFILTIINLSNANLIGYKLKIRKNYVKFITLQKIKRIFDTEIFPVLKNNSLINNTIIDAIIHSSFSSEENKNSSISAIETCSEDQKKAVYYLIDQAFKMEKPKNNTEKIKHNEGEKVMKKNIFANDVEEPTLSHADIDLIFSDAKRVGSLKDAINYHAEEGVLCHTVTDESGEVVTYGIANIDYLFPDAQKISNTPEFYKREDAWVSTVMTGTHHSPFSRIKSLFADITMDEARAKGYVKGNEKTEEVFALLKRTTTPQTIYKKQKLDRDDIIDITDFDVVAWLKSEMRIMLDEEIARAILVGDGRTALHADKIKPDNIRPIWTDDDFYTIKAVVEVDDSIEDESAQAKKIIRKIIKSRKDYKGSGNPVLFTTEDFLTDCLLIEDNMGRVIYDTEEKLRTALRVSKIVTVPVMEGLSRTVTTATGSETRYLKAIVVNLNDYNVGADKGGAVNMFDDFDIDFNQEKYLIETRCSGALIRPKSAIAIEVVFQ